MKTLGELEKCRLYLESHSLSASGKPEVRPFITISRETGTSARVIAEQIAEILQKNQKETTPTWTIFDKNLIEKILEDHHLPKALSALVEEDKFSHVSTILSELFIGQSWSLIHQISRAILQLAGLGNVIFIGMGAHIITSRLPNCFNVRLVAPLEERVKRFVETYNIDRKAAMEMVTGRDHARARYLKSVFNKRIDDPLLYHLVINTGRMDAETVAFMISDSVIKKFQDLFYKREDYNAQDTSHEIRSIF